MLRSSNGSNRLFGGSDLSHSRFNSITRDWWAINENLCESIRRKNRARVKRISDSLLSVMRVVTRGWQWGYTTLYTPLSFLLTQKTGYSPEDTQNEETKMQVAFCLLHIPLIVEGDSLLEISALSIHFRHFCAKKNLKQSIIIWTQTCNPK